MKPSNNRSKRDGNSRRSLFLIILISLGFAIPCLGQPAGCMGMGMMNTGWGWVAGLMSVLFFAAVIAALFSLTIYLWRRSRNFPT